MHFNLFSEPSTRQSAVDEELTSSQYQQQSVSQPVATGKIHIYLYNLCTNIHRKHNLTAECL